MRELAIIGIGQTVIDEHWDRSLRDLAGEDVLAVEQGAVARDEVADAFRGRQHLGDHHSDDDQCAANPERGRHRRHRGRQQHPPDHLPA